MKFFNLFGRRDQTPPLTTHRYKVDQRDKLKLEVKSLDEFYDARLVHDSAGGLMEEAVQRRSEHPDQDVRKVEVEREHYDGPSDRGVWDTKKDTFTFTSTWPKEGRDYEKFPTYGLELSEPKKEWRVLMDRSSGEVHPLAIYSQPRAERAQMLVQAARLWHAQSQALDGKDDLDFHPSAGKVVAGGVPAALVAETLDRQSVLNAGRDKAFRTLDLQSDANSFYVIGQSSGDGLKSDLSGTVNSDGDLVATFRDLTSKTAERVVWSKSQHTLLYQQLDLIG